MFESDIFFWIIAILAFSLIVIVHELGHFLAAKRSGVKVLEFGLGYPPRLIGKKIKETIYSINIIPFGGFVRMLDEDMPGENKNDPGSFSNKSVWKRMKITVAGVLFNFIFALVALTIGFSIGIEPLIVEYDDVLKAYYTDAISVEHGFRVEGVEKDSLADASGIKEGDTILAIDGMSYAEFAVTDWSESDRTFSKITYLTDNVSFGYESPTEYKYDQVGLTVKNPGQLPRLKFFNSYGQVEKGDIIYEVNDQKILVLDDLIAADAVSEIDSVELLRNGEFVDVEMQLGLSDIDSSVDSENLSQRYKLVVDGFAENSPAENAGFESNDQIVSINNVDVYSIEELRGVAAGNIGETVDVVLNRDGELISKQLAIDDDGMIGVYLMPLIEIKENVLLQEFYEEVSIVEIGKVKYPVHKAFYHSVNEVGRLGLFSVKMFGDVVSQIVSKFSVPETVAGPVGIAKMSVDFAKEGLLSLLRFIAVISLSLAVLNLLPIPALDGGKLVFLIIEAIRGKRINPKVEQIIHTVGFFLLIIMLLFVSYNDIIR